jgi:hypothetical protein
VAWLLLLLLLLQQQIPLHLLLHFQPAVDVQQQQRALETVGC